MENDRRERNSLRLGDGVKCGPVLRFQNFFQIFLPEVRETLGVCNRAYIVLYAPHEPMDRVGLRMAISEFEQEIGSMIVETLNLQGVAVDDIDPEQPLFRDGLGLDSIDALELSLAISRQYGVQIKTENTDVAQVFASMRSLSEYIQINRQR